MRYARLSVVVLCVLMVIAGIGYLSWILYQKLHQQDESPLKAISENTALIIQLNHPSELTQDLYHRNLIWKELSIIPYFASLKNDIRQIDSLLKTNNALVKITQKYPLYLAMTMINRSSYSFLFLTSIPGTNGEDMVTGFLEDNYKNKISILKNQYGSANLVRIILKGKMEPFYFAVRKGVFMGSTHPEMVTKAIDQLSLNIPSVTGSGFQKVENTTGKKVDANIYINYRLMRPFISNLLQPDQSNEIYRLTRFADWSGLDVILKKDEMLINGFTTISDTGSQYISLFSGQSPQKTGVLSILPDNISRFVWIGYNSISDYYRNYQIYASKNQGYLDTYKSLQEFELHEQVSVRDFFLPWLGNELCMATALNNAETLRDDPYAILRLSNRPLADSLLKELGKLLPKRKDSVLYREHTIQYLPFPDLFAGLFGSAFSEVHCNCYTFLDDYIVFGNDLLAMKDLIDHFIYGRVLEKDKSFQAVSENISDNTNIFYYFNTARSYQTLRRSLSDELNAQLEPVFDTLKKFESIALQFSAKGNMFYTSLFIHYNPSFGNQGPMEWQVPLDTLVFGLPQIVRTGQHGSNALLAFDMANHLYMVDSSGAIRWKIQLPGRPQGTIHQIFPDKDDTSLFLFNSDSHLCLINSNGKFVAGFPVKLPAIATGSLTLSAFGKNKEYRILIPLSDNKVHAFAIDGKAVPNWPNPGLNEGITQPVEVLQNGKQDFIFITGKNGHLLVTDRKGKLIMRSGRNLKVSANNTFYSNRTNRKGLFLTTDPTGKVIYFQESGKTSEATFNIFSPAHRFLYLDINNDNSYEFVFYDHNKIYFYNRFYKLIYSYSFHREITILPFIIDLPGGQKRIGAVSGPANEIYLFGSAGLIEIQTGIRGNTPYTIGRLTDNSGYNLLIGSGKNLKNYFLPE